MTGGNRGIGLEVCRQLARKGLRVVLSARHTEEGRRAAEALQADGFDVVFERLDVARDASVDDCARRLLREGIHVDVLINNAAIFPSGTLLRTTQEMLRETLEVNFFGPVRTCQAFVPAMIRAGYGRVVNVSSGAGAFAEGLEGPAAYALSKAALNALTVKLASEVRGDVKVNAVCPGWVRTRMGGPGAPVEPEEAAETIVWLATLPARGPTGGFFRNRRRIRW